MGTPTKHFGRFETTLIVGATIPLYGRRLPKSFFAKKSHCDFVAAKARIRSSPDGGSLAITLPGIPEALAKYLDRVMAAVPYCIELIGGPILETDPTRIEAFRPKKK